MNITEDAESGVVVLRPAGRLDSAASPQLEERVFAAIERGEARIVIDLAEVTYVSSRGLRSLLLGAKKAAEAGGRLAVCSLQDFVREVFESVGFFQVLTVFPNSAEAIDSFGAEESC